MRISRALVAAVLLSSVASAQGPDVIVGDLTGPGNYGTNGSGIYAYSVGTTSCNIGTQTLSWVAGTNQHPVIGQNFYRMKDGRFQQLGLSWLKHGFTALQGNVCATAQNPCVPGSGSALGVYCSDPYGPSLNGSQSNGPRNEVNPATGYFPYPIAGSYPAATPVIGRRIQVQASDIDPLLNPGALYFCEGQYVTPDDAAAGNQNNNASYRMIEFNPATLDANMVPGQTTQRMKPAIQAWQDHDPTVQIHYVDIPADGRVIVAFKGWPLANGLHHFEYAVQNLNSDRAIGGFSVELWPGANPVNIGSNAIPHHSGEPYATAPWTHVHAPGSLFPGSLKWSTVSHAVNPNANALRWGTLFNFWFDCDQLPGDVTLDIFKPGSPATVSVPSFCAPKRPPPVAQPYNLFTSTPYDYVDISTTGFPGPIGNDNSFAVPLGFTFPFYGQNYTNLVVSTNGYLTVPGESGVVATNTALPNAGAPSGIIAGYWDDLDCPIVTNIRYQTVGTAPNQRFVVYWNCVHAGDTQPLRFELILEPDGTIVNTIVQCPVTHGGGSATRGIEKWDDSSALQYSYNTPGSAQNLTSIRYEINTGFPATANMIHAGSLGGGPFKIVYVSEPSSPVLTVVSLDPTPTDLGIYGIVPLNVFSALPIFDHFGLLTGVPNTAATTNSTCGSIGVTVWVSPGSLPSGAVLYHTGVDFPTPGSNAPNGIFHGANLVVTPVP